MNSRTVILITAIAYYGFSFLIFYWGGVIPLQMLFMVGGTAALVHYIFYDIIQIKRAILKEFNREQANHNDTRRYLLIRLMVLIPFVVIVVAPMFSMERIRFHGSQSELPSLIGIIVFSIALFPQHLNYLMRRLTHGKLNRSINDWYNSMLILTIATIVSLACHYPDGIDQPDLSLLLLLVGWALFKAIRLVMVWKEYRQNKTTVNIELSDSKTAIESFAKEFPGE